MASPFFFATTAIGPEYPPYAKLLAVDIKQHFQNLGVSILTNNLTRIRYEVAGGGLRQRCTCGRHICFGLAEGSKADRKYA